MPREGITVYDLLLSCPGDVVDLRSVVAECVENFNRTHGSHNNVKIEIKHWSTDAYPQSGGGAQELLNKQFINNCDACIALFGNKFGSPTDEFESGTEQEIEEMILADKQVFMYFIERVTDPSSIDLDQLKKVRDFKKKYSKEKKGIYCEIKNDNEFKTKLLDHLTLYFLNEIVEPQAKIQQQKESKLELLINKLPDRSLAESNILYRKKDEIKETIDVIQSIEVVNNVVEEISEEKAELISMGMNLQKALKGLIPEEKKVFVSECQKEIILKYCNSQKIALEQSFWNIGNLKEVQQEIEIYYSSSNKLNGEEWEKRKYELIQKLYKDIINYNNYFKFFKTIDAYSYFECYVNNLGTTFDEDIDIKIKIPQNCIVKKNELPIPMKESVEALNKLNVVEQIFTMKNNPDIEQYSDYQTVGLSRPIYDLGLVGVKMSAKYERAEKEYMNEIDRIFCYEYYEDYYKDIIKFKVNYLKQNTCMYAPSLMLFKKEPEYIEYEIRSKYYPKVITGKIEVKK